MFHSLTRSIIRRPDTFVYYVLGGSTFAGSCIGGYRGYTDSRTFSYDDCLMNTTVVTFMGGYCGFLTAITLPITVPITISVTILRYFDKNR